MDGVTVDCILDPTRKPPQYWLGKAHVWILPPGPWAYLVTACLTCTPPHSAASSLCLFLRMGRVSFSRMLVSKSRKPACAGQGTTTILRCKATFRTTKERLSCIVGLREEYKLKNSVTRGNKKCGVSIFIRGLRMSQNPKQDWQEIFLP